MLKQPCHAFTHHAKDGQQGMLKQPCHAFTHHAEEGGGGRGGPKNGCNILFPQTVAATFQGIRALMPLGLRRFLATPVVISKLSNKPMFP